MLKILILVCPMTVDHAHCDRDTALDIVRSSRVSNAEQCGFMAQAALASTALVPQPDKQYVKVLCLREPPAELALAKP